MSQSDHESTSADSRENLGTQWFDATFRPRAFFSKTPEKRNRRQPIVFAMGVSFVTAVVGAVLAVVLTEEQLNVASLIWGPVVVALAAAISVCINAALVHGFLRLVGAGKGSIPTSSNVAPKDITAQDSNEPYAPPAAVGPGGHAGIGEFSETLQVVGYSQGPVVLTILGFPGQTIASVWGLVLLMIGVSCIHRISFLRSFAVTFTALTGPLIFALTLRSGVIEAFKIPSGAMMPTLMIGDHIFVNKLVYGPLLPGSNTRLFSRLPPARGDVMVFKFPENKAQDFIKRAIALPGDKLEAINGRPIINDWLVPHCYVGEFGPAQDRLYVEFLEDKSFLTLYAQDGLQSKGPDEPTCKDQDDCAIGQTCRVGICGHHQGPFKVGPNEVWVMGDNRLNSHDSRSWRGGQGAGVPFENIKGRAMMVWMSFGASGGIVSDRLFVPIMGTPIIPGNPDKTLQSALDKCLRERPESAKTTPPLPK